MLTNKTVLIQTNAPAPSSAPAPRKVWLKPELSVLPLTATAHKRCRPWWACPNS